MNETNRKWDDFIKFLILGHKIWKIIFKNTKYAPGRGMFGLGQGVLGLGEAGIVNEPMISLPFPYTYRLKTKNYSIFGCENQENENILKIKRLSFRKQSQESESVSGTKLTYNDKQIQK